MAAKKLGGELSRGPTLALLGVRIITIQIVAVAGFGLCDMFPDQRLEDALSYEFKAL